MGAPQAAQNAVTHFQHFALALVEPLQVAPDTLELVPVFHQFRHRVGLRTENINEGDFVALFVDADRIE
ncbi:MAG: hypothetical protein H5U01_03150 [Clostridia bacterium]|nr:hypothetical protein [Clostridia bacterium]